MRRTALLLLVALLVAGCNRPPVDYDLYARTPTVQVTVALRAMSEQELDSMLRSFATDNEYTLRVAQVHPSDPLFSVMLWRADSLVLATNSYGPFTFSFYPAKSKGISSDAAKVLVAELSRLGST